MNEEQKRLFNRSWNFYGKILHNNVECQAYSRERLEDLIESILIASTKSNKHIADEARESYQSNDGQPDCETPENPKPPTGFTNEKGKYPPGGIKPSRNPWPQGGRKCKCG